MEPGEEVTEAAIREVKEETGLDFEPSTLLSIEAAGKILIVFKVYHYFFMTSIKIKITQSMTIFIVKVDHGTGS